MNGRWTADSLVGWTASVSGLNSASASSRVPKTCPLTETTGGPPAGGGGANDKEQLMLFGAFAAKACQAWVTSRATAHGQVRLTVVTKSTGCVRKTSLVTTPKLPAPAPRSAQNNSGSLCALQKRCRPSAVTTSICVRLSHARPRARDEYPWPPPRVSPETPTASQVPNGTARPMVQRRA